MPVHFSGYFHGLDCYGMYRVGFDTNPQKVDIIHCLGCLCRMNEIGGITTKAGANPIVLERRKISRHAITELSPFIRWNRDGN